MLNILSACKAEKRGSRPATASNDNAADDKIGSVRASLTDGDMDNLNIKLDYILVRNNR